MWQRLVSRQRDRLFWLERRSWDVLEAKLFGISELHLLGVRINPPTRKALGLIGLLLLDGETSRDRLASLLWGKANAERARRNLRQELYRLSITPLGRLLEQSGDALRLTPPFESDVAQFRAAVRAGRFTEALELHRGRLLEYMQVPGAPGFVDWLERERAVLAALRREALRGWAAQLGRAGAHREALAAYLECLEEDELQEDLHREVMRLYGSLGERGPALAQYQLLKRILRRQVGLEPLPETTRLAEQIRTEQALPQPAEQFVTSPSTKLAPFVGRGTALNQLRNSTGVSLIGGEPGVGKTRLCLEAAGERSFVLRGQELLGGVGLQSVADAVRTALQHGSRLDGLPEVWLTELARLLPELTSVGVPLGAGSAAPEGRARFLYGLAQVLAHLVPRGGSLVLDDLHWFDAVSLEVVTQLEPLLSASGVGIIATARDAELLENADATRWLAGLERAGKLNRISLNGLTEDDLNALSTWMLGSASSDLTVRLHRATAGNPLYALETLRDLSDAPGDDAALPIPASVMSAVKNRVDRLGKAVRRALEAASLIEGEVRLELVTGGSALGEWQALEALERATVAGLLTEVDDARRFSHDLVRECLARELSAERRRLLHRQLGQALEAQRAPSASVAVHLERGGHARRAVSFRIRAAEEAVRVFAYREALTHYEVAINNGLDESETFRVRQQRVRLFENSGEVAGWSLEVDAMNGLAVRLRDSELQLEVKLERARNRFATAQFEDARAISQAVLADAAPGSLLHTRALVQSARALQRLGRITETQEHLERALAELKPDAFALRAEVYELLTAVAFNREDWAITRAHNEAALKAAIKAGSETGEIIALNNRARLAERQSDPTASALFERAYLRALEARMVALQATALLGWSAALMNGGRFHEAATKTEAGLALTPDLQNPRLRARFLTNRAIIRESQGALGDSISCQLEAIAIFDEIGEVFHATHARINLADLFADCGDTAGARTILEPARTAIQTAGFAGLQVWHEATLVRCDLTDQRSPRLERLESHLNSDIKTDEFARRYARCVLAEARLAIGDAVEALELVAGLDAPSPIHAVAVAIRVAAQVALRRQSVASLEEALALIDSLKVPNGPKLLLYCATVSALELQRPKNRALELRGRAQRFIVRLGNSLGPQHREGFLANWTRQLEAGVRVGSPGRA